MASNNVAEKIIIELQPNWVGKLFGAYTRLTIDVQSFYIEERNCKQTLIGTFNELAALPTAEKRLLSKTQSNIKVTYCALGKV